MKLLSLLLLCSAQAASAAVFRCEAPGGKTTYQSTPCEAGKSTEVKVEAPAVMAVPASAASRASPTERSEPSGWRPGAEPEVVGSEWFRERVRQALDLLKSRDPQAHAVVARYVGRIEQGPRSGMRAYADPPTFFMSDATARPSVTWAASAIAHDSYHSKLYHDHKASHPGAVPADVWTGRPAESQCVQHQVEVMKRIGAPQREIDHAMSYLDGHHVTDPSSWEERNRRAY